MTRKYKYSCFVEWSAKALKAEKTCNNTRWSRLFVLWCESAFFPRWQRKVTLVARLEIAESQWYSRPVSKIDLVIATAYSPVLSIWTVVIYLVEDDHIGIFTILKRAETYLHQHKELLLFFFFLYFFLLRNRRK